MTLYLTDSTTPDDIAAAAQSHLVCGVRTLPRRCDNKFSRRCNRARDTETTLEAMQSHNLPLLVHGEVTDPDVDIFDREAKFIERTLAPLTEEFPELRVILEHITTEDSVNFVTESRPEWRQRSHRSTYSLIETTCLSAVLDRIFFASHPQASSTQRGAKTSGNLR